MSIKLSFHGGVDGVTGSCHMLQTEDMTLLVDCGFFQGGYHIEEKNREDFGFDPSSIDFLLLTHGHLDHCGRIPLLVKNGFQGKIVCTPATYDIARIIMLDTAEIQEEDAAHWGRINRRRGLKSSGPLYTTLDALDALKFFSVSATYGKPVKLSDDVSVTFKDAGHILGAAFLEIDIKGKRIIFSGDLGNRQKPIIRDPEYPEKADICVIEGTYSNRSHKDIETSVRELYAAVEDTCKRGGNVLIPSFAVERAQDILFYLSRLRYKEELPVCRVFLDSPMAISINEVMGRHPECFDEETRKLLSQDHDPFDFPGLHLTRTPEDSKKINFIDSHAVVIAGSGMCTGGRIKHHLKHNIWRDESSIIFVGYQAAGTLGRKIVDGEEEVRIYGEKYRVRARVYTIGGFSAHADRTILLDWLKHCERPDHLFMVHGEQDTLSSFRAEVAGKNLAGDIHVPGMHQSFRL